MPGPYAIVTDPDGERGVELYWHNGQQRAWDSEARFPVVLAGIQSGKTVFGPFWLAREIAATADPEGHENDYIAATANYKVFSRKMLPAMVEVFERVLKIGRYWASDQIFELCEPSTGKFWADKASDPMWGRILLGSAAAVSGLESATARAAWTDEWGMDEVTLGAQDAIESRLAIRQGRQLVTTTAYNVGLIKIRFYDPWTGGDPNFEVINFESIENPAFPREEFERQRRILPTWKFDMRYRGLLTKPAGLIYSDYEDSYVTAGGHLIKPFTIPKEWLRTVGVDFGAINTAHLWIAEEPETGDCYIYRTAKRGDKTAGEWARECLEYKEPVRQWIGGSPSENDARTDWGLADVPVEKPVISDVETQIDRVTALWKTNRLFVFDTLTGLRIELQNYSRELDDAGEPTPKIKDDKKYHLLAALRYAVTGIDIDRPKSAEEDHEPLGRREPKRERPHVPDEAQDFEDYSFDDYS